jgi:hypothetical protein
VDDDDRARDAWTRLVLGQWLLRWRHELGTTQRRVARLAGVDQGFLSRVERGQRRIAGAPLSRLIITLDWLSGGGLPGGPFASTHVPLPPAYAHRRGIPPPVVVGTVAMTGAGHDQPHYSWQDAEAAMDHDAAERTSRLQAPTLTDALVTRVERRNLPPPGS